jgi:NAD(P)-dependent dehydrogenase (short-subunit alcohol dehydrogenase family)
MPRTVLITGASSGIGALTARELAERGHHVWAGMRSLPSAASDDAFSGSLRAVQMDVTSEAAVAAARETIRATGDEIDTIIHNAGHMAQGPAESFTPQQFAALYDVNVLGAHRVNRAFLPDMRSRRAGSLIWVGSSSTRGGHTPFISPYFAAKAAMDSLAVDYADELIRFGISTTIVVPGAFASGTNHFDNAGRPEDQDIAAAYDVEYGELMNAIRPTLAALAPPGSDVTLVSAAIGRLVDMPPERRPFRVTIDPNRNGSEVVSAVADRIRADFYRRIGLADLLAPNSHL